MSPPVNNVLPRAFASKVVCVQGGLAFVFSKFRALQLAAGNAHRPDNSSVTHKQVKCSSQEYALSLTWPDPTARLDTLSLVPRPSGLVFVSHGSLPFTLLSTASNQWWGKNVQGKNVQGKNLGRTVHKS